MIPPPESVPSPLERFRTVLVEKLGEEDFTEDDILIFGVKEITERVVDVTFAVRVETGEYIRSSYLDGLLITDRADVSIVIN